MVVVVVVIVRGSRGCVAGLIPQSMSSDPPEKSWDIGKG